FAVQLAKLHGLKVIGTGGKASSVALLRELGVDVVIDYATQDVEAVVMQRTEGKGAELVYDSTYNQASYELSARLVARGGEYIRLGTERQMKQFGASDVTPIVEGRGAKMTIGDLGRYRLEEAWSERIAEVDEAQQKAIDWYVAGALRPVITATVPFDAAALQQAFVDFLAGKNNVGKIVVKVR
ncbi:MAG TPA: zinc-binding alcohol dehydrogenase family protein, partial [Kofleriaceae bacterium]